MREARTDIKAILHSRFAWLAALAVVILGASLLLAQVFTAEEAAATFDEDLYKEYKSHEVTTLNELAQDFEWQQALWMPLAPPSTEFWGWTQEAGPLPMPFDPANFPKDFVANLIPAYRDGVVVYPVTAWEDAKTRDRVFYNAEGKEIGSVSAPQRYYSRWCLYDMYPDMDARAWSTDYVNWLVLIYEPSHLLIRYDLILHEDLITWIAVQSIRAAAAAQAAALAGDGGGMALMRLPAADSNIVFQAITRATNGITLEIGYPNDFTNRLEIFTTTDLVAFVWTLTATNLATAGTNTIWWTDTDTNPVIRFYAAGNADVDSDGDGLKDAREKFLYHTSMTDRDSDGDGLVDGYSGVVSTNAYPGGAHTNGGAYVEGEMTWGTNPNLFDTDGDGMGDGWEVANGHNPLDPNDPPNVIGTVSYSGRQTGTVWVIAVTSSNSWSTNYSKTLSAPGAYQIPNLPGTNYWLKAWMDSNENSATNATEAWGAFTNNPVLVTNQVTGKDIALNDPDSDSDGLPDWWEVQYFGSITNWTGSGDPDSDQYTNQEEYEVDTDPTDSASHPWNISGTITYTGPQTGTIYIVACTSSIGWVAAQFTTLAAPGSYTITHLPPNADYWVKAWRDTSGDGSNTFWEAWGAYSGNPVYLGPNASGADIALADPDSDGDTLPDWWEIAYGLDPLNGNGDNAAAWWRFDEGSGTNVQDSTANTNHGVLCNIASNAWTYGVMSNAVSFNGTNAYAQFQDSASLKPNFVSVSLWIKPAQDYTNGSAVFFSKKQPTGATGYRLSYENGSLSFLICASGNKSVSLPYSLTNGVWHHVVGTYGGANHRLYVDGILRVSTNYDWGTGFGYIDQGTTAPRIGASTDSMPSNCFAGVIDDARVYDRELASNEVHAVYDLGADPDGDGLSNFDEYHYGAWPTNSDTDGDGISDGVEVHIYHTDPMATQNSFLPFTVGFEQTNSYSPGALNGQQGWLASSGV